MTMSKKVQLTAKGLEKLKKEFNELMQIKLPEMRVRMDEARKSGDLAENTGWDLIQEEYNNAMTRAEELDEIIKRATLISDCSLSGISIGCKVSVELDGKAKTYMLVSDKEADPSNNTISDKSPLGSALIGKAIGKTVSYKTPDGRNVNVKILKIEK